MTNIRAALLAGIVAITASTIVLKAAAPLGIVAESGGLLRLHVQHLAPMLRQFGVAGWWTSHGLPGPASLPFWLAFHYATGFVMVLLYTALLERALPGTGVLKGSLFSLIPWLINSLIVLPMLGEGAFGSRALSASGMSYFFMANWLFGAALGAVYARCRDT